MALAKRGVQQTPATHAAQWGDIDPEGRTELSSQMRELGNVKAALPERRAHLEHQAANAPSETGRTKAGQRLRAIDAMAPTFENKPMTLRGAATHRTELARGGARRSESEGLSSGANWYYEHHQKMANVAASTGIHKDKIIAASASMSPQNSPDQEHAAVKALAEAHSNPNARVRVTHEAVDAAVASVKDDAPRADQQRVEHERMREYVGHDLRPGQLEPQHLAMLSHPNVRGHVSTNNVDLGEIAKGGGKGQVAKAINVLRGNIAPDEANSPINAPKVWSYQQNIQHSVPGTNEQYEFLGRAHHATTQIEGQGRFDLHGLQGSHQGMLTESGHTAEDSWMHAINTRQQLAGVNIPGRTGRAGLQSPAKFAVGEGGGANAKALAQTFTDQEGNERSILRGAKLEGLEHAWSNRATTMAAGRMGMPSTAVQAMSWTESRRRAGKDPQYEAMRAGGDSTPTAAKGKQMEMFQNVGGAEQVRKQAKPPKGYSGEHGVQQSLF